MKMVEAIHSLMVSLVLFFTEEINGEQCGCVEVVYLQSGRKGIIPCQCDHYLQVGWYTQQDYDSSGSPFINFNNIENKTAGRKTAEYGVGLNGSLIIKNVSLSSDHNYVAEFSFDFDVGTLPQTSRPHVIVIVTPVPAHPVVNAHVNQQYVHMDVEREGTLHCSLAGVHPKVNLTWTVIDPNHREGISFQHGNMNSLQNEDGTFDVTVISNYKAELSMQSSIVQCKVTGEISSYFPAETTVELTFPSAQPIISGHPVYMEANRTGQLHCFKNNISPEKDLMWLVVEEALKDKITLQSATIRSSNEDGTVNVSLTSSYSVKDESVDRISIQCILTESGAYEPKATAKLLFVKAHPSAVPVIDGCYSQQNHCVLEAGRTGKLICTVKNSPYPVNLKWNLLNVDPSQLSFEDQPNIPNNRDSSDVSITTLYTVRDESLTRMTVQCQATEAGGVYPDSLAVVSLVVDTAGEGHLFSLMKITKLTLAMVVVFSIIDLAILIAGIVKILMKTKEILQAPMQTPRDQPLGEASGTSRFITEMQDEASC